MIDLSEVLEQIDSAPEGPETAAFFDFDGTIIDGFSVLAVLVDRGRRLDIAPAEVIRLLWAGIGAATGEGGFPNVLKAAVRELAGTPRAELDELGARLLQGTLGATLYPEAWCLVAAHHQRGHTVAVASSALPFQVEPLAEELGISNVLCTRFVERDGVMTGEVDGDILWGRGKAEAVRKFAAESGIDLAACFGYANGNEDIDFLSAVGRPRPINPSSGLATAAEERGWPVLRFEPRARPGLSSVVRTVAAYAGMASAVGAGVGIGLFNRSRSDAVNLTVTLGSETALGLAGIDVRISGEEHLWAQRPAVFIFNHQSWLDGLIVRRLLGRDVTVEADVSRAVAQLAGGRSVAVAPEATRSPTPRVGGFDDGVFRMAMRAGLPVVPVVLRNAGQLLGRGRTFLRSGTLDVAVLPSIAVEDWAVKDLGRRVTEVRDLFVKTLADWPASGRNGDA